jgi:hypothetical protein
MAVLSFPTPTVFRNLDTPTANTDATTKRYVDQKIANVVTGIVVSEINTANTITNSFSGISAIRFDKDTGFSVASWGNNTVKVSLGSSFKTWNVPGQASLVAVGEDTIKIIGGQGIKITTSNTSSGNKTLTFTANNTALRLYVANQISQLVNSAPEVLNTLREIAMAMGNNANFAANVNNALATKISNTVATTISVRDIIPAANNTYSLGSPGRRFKSLYVASNTIYIGRVSLGVSGAGVFQVTQANNVTQTIVTSSSTTGKTSISELVLQTVLGTKYGGTGLSSFTKNGVMFGANSSVIGFITGSSGSVMQITSNGTPAFTDLDGGSF